MARARNIKPSFFINEDLVELSFETRLLFIGLWTLADREGYLEDKPKKIKMALFPADDVNVDQMLNELQDQKFLIRYLANNRKCIFLPKFTKHQNPHHKESVNDVPRYNPVQDLGKPEAKLGQAQVQNAINVNADENQDYLSELNTITYGDDDQHLGQALDKPQSNPADILIPDSLNLIPDSGNLNTDNRDPRFDLSLVDVNTRLQMGGLKPISQDELNILIIKLQDAYSHKHQMVKNQILGKAFEWIERQQRTPLAQPKNPYQTAAAKTTSEQQKWDEFLNGGGTQLRDITPKKNLLIEEVGHA
ncbi:hypothetical protein [Acinetobacter radioresistens]|uniref:Uncharacterized protein n=1 Tax=Acinetobacter radioresistens TaxID=40216 RepID=A0A8H2K3G8_ACIRA|nr:hypothetical protein [Acinetobacter radioresistens]TNX93653.1 hypothetical protein FHY67_04235 [Acinetobacter radioresistens]